MLRLRRLLLLPLMLPLALAACEKKVGEDVPVRPPVVLDAATMDRLIAAMRELQDLSRALPLPEGQLLPIGVGVTYVLGDASVEIVKKHGFTSQDDFEGKLGYAQQALLQVQFEGRHGFDGDAQLFRLRGKRTDLEARRKEIEGDDELSDDMRRLMLAEVRMQLEDVEDRIEDVNDFASTLQTQYDNLPPENVESVRARLDDLLALIAPDGTLRSRPVGDGN